MAGPITIATALSRHKKRNRNEPLPIIDIDDTGPVPRQDLTFWERNALGIITATLGVLFVLVIVVQMVT